MLKKLRSLLRDKCEEGEKLYKEHCAKKKIARSVYPDKAYSFNEIAQNMREQLLVSRNAEDIQ